MDRSDSAINKTSEIANFQISSNDGLRENANELLAEGKRLSAGDRTLTGDLAKLHSNLSDFLTKSTASAYDKAETLKQMERLLTNQNLLSSKERIALACDFLSQAANKDSSRQNSVIAKATHDAIYRSPSKMAKLLVDSVPPKQSQPIFMDSWRSLRR
ncbi:MAG: hypothetical protein K2X27_14765 [Candidatus Obscuribacterales bacterium]|nr:hypothetical protein [Candidatus Obscuribacterales bacterium]